MADQNKIKRLDQMIKEKEDNVNDAHEKILKKD